MEDGRNIISSQLPAIRKIVSEPQIVELLSYVEKLAIPKQVKEILNQFLSAGVCHLMQELISLKWLQSV